MKFCNDKHPEVAFDSSVKHCPVCEAYDHLNYEVDQLQHIINNLEGELDVLNTELDRCVCKKLAD